MVKESEINVVYLAPPDAVTETVKDGQILMNSGLGPCYLPSVEVYPELSEDILQRANPGTTLIAHSYFSRNLVNNTILMKMRDNYWLVIDKELCDVDDFPGRNIGSGAIADRYGSFQILWADSAWLNWVWEELEYPRDQYNVVPETESETEPQEDESWLKE